MLDCYATQGLKNPIPVQIVLEKQYPLWFEGQTEFVKQWLSSLQFRGEAGSISIIPNTSGRLESVICCIADIKNLWGVGQLPMILPEGQYQFSHLFAREGNEGAFVQQFAIAWGLGAYQFTHYKKSIRKPAQLLLSDDLLRQHVNKIVKSIYLVRDLINMPTDDLGPSEFARMVSECTHAFKVTLDQIIGDDLLVRNFPLIHAVGRASNDPPRLLDLRWGDPTHPTITLVGKGVCFDSGGLDLKSSSGMLLMKKDMAGAAHVLGLAHMIMQAELPVYLRVLMPLVENVISGNAFHPGDIIKSRKGITIEIGNTDAEGRVILADALTEAVDDKPDLLIDMSTLTGAARIALGTDLPALFSNRDDIAKEIISHGNEMCDPVWHMPLFPQYRESLNTPFADINNTSSDSYGGAITAALFLKEFIPDDIPWVHLDLMAWNLKPRPGRPQGGEAMALRALFSYLSSRYTLRT